MSEANARQLVTRARPRCPANIAGRSVPPQQRLLDAFVAAAQTRDIATLEQLLAGCAGYGEVVHAARGPVREGSLLRVAA